MKLLFSLVHQISHMNGECMDFRWRAFERRTRKIWDIYATKWSIDNKSSRHFRIRGLLKFRQNTKAVQKLPPFFYECFTRRNDSFDCSYCMCVCVKLLCSMKSTFLIYKAICCAHACCWRIMLHAAGLKYAMTQIWCAAVSHTYQIACVYINKVDYVF
jgi:hypothetical protein